jgi:CheY-like chemotaxis protein
MAHQIVTHYTASAQPQYLLAGMPALKQARPEALGLARLRNARRQKPEVFLLPAMRQRSRTGHRGRVTMRCLLVDDNAAFLETARSLLVRDGLTVAGTASSSAEAMRQAFELRPDIALVDIGLGTENGFDLARDLAARGIAVIMTSTRPQDDYADLITDTRAAGFMPKAELSAAAILRILGA